MARIVQCGLPNPSESKALDHLRVALPDDWTIYHNFHIVLDNQEFEIDALLVAPKCLFLIDFKGTRGRIEIDQHDWYRNGQQLFPSPLRKIQLLSKKLKSRLQKTCGNVWVFPSIVLSDTNFAPTAKLATDETKHHLQDIHLLQESKNYFLAKPADHWRPLKYDQLEAIHSFMRNFAKPAKTAFRDWLILDEQEAVSPRYKEFLVQKRDNKHIQKKLRAYPIGSFDGRLLNNDDVVLSRMPAHQNIVPISEAFVDEDENFYILVTDKVDAKPLSVVLTETAFANPLHELPHAAKQPAFNARCKIIQDILTGLSHAHSNGVVHRNLSPDAVLVDSNITARLTGFEFGGFTGEQRTQTVRDLLPLMPDSHYAAPESYPSMNCSVVSDIFSAGVICFQILIGGKRPFETRSQLLSSDWQLPRQLGEYGVTGKYHAWLANLCAKRPSDRFQSAGDALDAFRELDFNEDSLRGRDTQ